VTQGSLKSYEAQVQLARNALRDAVVTAPLSGTLAKRHVQPGEKVNFDSPLFTIVDLDRMELLAMVPANDIPEIRVAMPADPTIDGFVARTSGLGGAHQPDHGSGHARSWCSCRFPIPTPRCAAARSTGASTCRRCAVRPAGGGDSSAGKATCGSSKRRLVRRAVTLGRRDEASTRRAEERAARGAGARRALRQPQGGPAVLRAAPPKAAGAG
jgi:hypothetical protein